MGVVGLGQQPRLLAESLPHLGPSRPLRPQDLEGDDRAVRGVPGPVDGALAPLSQQLEELEPSQGLGEAFRGRSRGWNVWAIVSWLAADPADIAGESDGLHSPVASPGAVSAASRFTTCEAEGRSSGSGAVISRMSASRPARPVTGCPAGAGSPRSTGRRAARPGHGRRRAGRVPPRPRFPGPGRLRRAHRPHRPRDPVGPRLP